MTQQLYTQLSLWLTPNRLWLIRLGLAGLAVLAAAIQPQIAWADLSGGGSGGS